MDNVSILIICLFLFMVLTITGSYNIQQMHSGGFYRVHNLQENLGPVVYYEEGLYATVTVRETPLKAVIDYEDEQKEDVVLTDLPVKGHALFFNGYGQGGYEITDLRVNFLLSYLPLLINPEIEDALVIGLGTGTTSGQLAKNVDTTTIEIEPAVLGVTPYFELLNENVLDNPNHTIITADARNHLTKENTKYDLIVSEPTNTWQSFSTALFSKEFLQIINEDLNEEGLYIQWVPIYDFRVEDFKNYYRTFNSVFPYNVAFKNLNEDDVAFGISEPSEIILVGSKRQINLNQEKFSQNYDSLSDSSKQFLVMIGLDSGEDIYNLVLFTDEQIKGYADSAKIITDDKPILEFSTAKNVLNQNPEAVINDINKYLNKNVE